MTATRFLVDATAIAHYPNPQVGARLDGLAMDGRTVSCGVVELQLLGAVSDPATRARVAALRAAAFEVLETNGDDFRRAAQIQTLLAEQGECGIAWPALVIAAVAQRHEVSVLHCDRQYDVIQKVTGQATETAG